MWEKRIILAAVGEKGVSYGNEYPMPRAFLPLVQACKASYYHYDLHPGGCIIAYPASARSFRLMEQFLFEAEALRENLPGLGIGITDCCSPVCFRLPHHSFFHGWLQFEIDRDTELQVLAKVQGSQTYRDDFKSLQIS